MVASRDANVKYPYGVYEKVILRNACGLHSRDLEYGAQMAYRTSTAMVAKMIAAMNPTSLARPRRPLTR